MLIFDLEWQPKPTQLLQNWPDDFVLAWTDFRKELEGEFMV